MTWNLGRKKKWVASNIFSPPSIHEIHEIHNWMVWSTWPAAWPFKILFQIIFCNMIKKISFSILLMVGTWCNGIHHQSLGLVECIKIPGRHVFLKCLSFLLVVDCCCCIIIALHMRMTLILTLCWMMNNVWSQSDLMQETILRDVFFVVAEIESLLLL